MTCIFCEKLVDDCRIEHILPESLGGKEWACLPKGIMCSSCNQYFGSKVEQKALHSFPFLEFRLLLNIPTKKRHAPEMDTYLGKVGSSGILGQIGINPKSREVEAKINSGILNKLIISTEITEPLAICRLLLKMGLQVIASDSIEDIKQAKFDDARTFARATINGTKWWFMMFINHDCLFQKFINGITFEEWCNNIKLEVLNIKGAEVFHLKLLDIDFITPLESRIIPEDLESLPEPDYRFVWASLS